MAVLRQPRGATRGVAPVSPGHMNPNDLLVWVGPGESRKLLAAVERAGARLSDPSAASVIVWTSSDDGPETLRGLLHPGIRLVQLDSAGVDHWIESGVIDRDRAWAAAQGAYAAVLAEHALTLLLAAAKRLPKAARAHSWANHRTYRLSGSTIGLIGAGAIGRRLATLLAPFDAEILAVNRSGTIVAGAHQTFPGEGLHDVLRRSDYAVVAAALTPSTYHLIGERELALLGPDGWLINVGRGALVDTVALVSALQTDRVGGACLDVTDPEPLPDAHPLWSLPNVLITPHAANWWGDHFQDLAVRVEDNLRRFRAGLPLVGAIDLELGY